MQRNFLPHGFRTRGLCCRWKFKKERRLKFCYRPTGAAAQPRSSLKSRIYAALPAINSHGGCNFRLHFALQAAG
jgi:hypothetical protein